MQCSEEALERSPASSVTVSVVMPCFNAARHLRQALASVLHQRFGNLEVVFVDDGSTDESAAIAAGCGDARVRVLRQQNAGVSAARNRGIAAARGEFLAFLDADDHWSPDFLAKLHAALESTPDAVIAYCGWQNVGAPDKSRSPYVPPDYETPSKLAQLIEACPWPIHAALTRTSLVRSAGGFDTGFAHAEDFALWLRLARIGPVVRVPEVLAFYNHHGGQQASRNRLRVALQTFEVQQRFLDEAPGLETSLGRQEVRRKTLGALLSRGYESYWAGDLDAARGIFRKVMRAGYGQPRDWKYMLPALLPAPLHQRMLDLVRGRGTLDEHS
jgi:GT2 family glycosyltransferase